MIGDIRKYPKVILAIFTLCCIMFIADMFVRSFFIGRKDSSKKIKMPDVIEVLNKKLSFDEYNSRFTQFSDNNYYTYERYGIDRNSRLFKSIAHEYVVNEFINSVIFNEMANILKLKIEDKEKEDAIYGENLDSRIKSLFVDSNRNFDRAKYNDFLARVAVNNNLKNYWSKSVASIINLRLEDKVKSILCNLKFSNSLELKRKFANVKSKYNVKCALKNISKDKADDSGIDSKISDYYEKNKDLYKNKETFLVKYFINTIDVNDAVKKYNLDILQPLIDKFKNTLNPLNMAKARSDAEDGKTLRYSMSFTVKDLPKCLKGKTLTKGIVSVEFPKKANDMIKIYYVTDSDIVNGGSKCDVAVLYKNLVIDDSLKNQALATINNELKEVNNVDEFSEFAQEKGYSLEDLKLRLDSSDIKGFSNIDLLKKEIIKEEFKGKKDKFLPVIPDKNGFFVGYIYDYLPKDSYKKLDDVKMDIKRIIETKSIKKLNNDVVKNDALYKKTIDEYKKNKDFKFVDVNNLTLDEIKEKKLPEGSRVEKLIKKCELLNKIETRFFYFDDRLVKIKLEKNIDNKIFYSDDFKEFKKEEDKENSNIYRNDRIFGEMFKGLYSINKLDNAYCLL